ncbi:MAG: YidC/Oxa1 family membrane protein insertase [Candidatus Kaiserbacteria bacterium]|nr:YidC/Oxa1 family membrane protein insertase [Candidatus Kaiserbacteria bacterium]
MGFLFTVFYQPTANILFFLMELLSTNSIVVGILALVIASKLILLPSSVKNTRMQIKMRDVADELQEIKKSTDDRKEQAEKTLAVYKKNNINPLTPIASLFIQIPIFISIFFVVRDLGTGEFPFSDVFYSFVTAPESINYTFLSSSVLFVKGGILVAVLVFLTQLLITHFTTKNTPGSGKKTQKIIFFGVMPILIAIFSFFMTATVGLYWLFNNLVTILQEVLVMNKFRQEDAVLEQAEHPEG